MRSLRTVLSVIFIIGCAGGGEIVIKGEYKASSTRDIGFEVPEELTLTTAERIALANSPLVLQAKHDLEAARAAVSEARAGLFPTLSATYGYWRRDPRQGMVMRGEIPLPPPAGPIPFSQEVYMGDRGYSFFNARAQMALYTFGAISSAIRAAKADTDAARCNLESAKLQAKKTVRSAFFRALLAEAGLKLARKALETTKKRFKQVKSLYEAGVVTKYELLSAKAALADVEARLAKAEEGVKTAYAALANAMGLQPQKFKLVYPRFDFPDSVNPEKLTDIAMNVNPSLKALRKTYLALYHRRQAAYAAHFPKVLLSAAYNWADDETLISKGYGEVRLMLTWDIFTGGRTAAQVRRLEETLKRMGQAIREAKEGLRLAIYTNCARYVSAKAEFRAAEEALRKAEAGLRQKESEFEEGVATMADLIAAELELISAQTRLKSLKIEMAKTLAEIEALVGQKLWQIVK